MPDRTRHLIAPSLRYFAAVARHGSFRAAARDLNVASSAVNRQILGLEADLGVALFERIGRRIRLSPSGEILLRHVTDSIRDFEAASAEIDALKGLRRGRVTLATVESVAQDLLPDIVTAFSATQPGIEISMLIAGSEEVTRLVASGGADLGFTFNPGAERQLDIALRRTLRIGAVMAPDHPLARLPEVRLADCMAHPLVLPARGLSIRAALDATATFRSGGGRAAIESTTLAFMRAIARRGRHIGFQTLIDLNPDLSTEALVFRPVMDPDLAFDRFALVVRADRTLNLAAASFHSFAIQEIARRLPVNDAETAATSS